MRVILKREQILDITRRVLQTYGLLSPKLEHVESSPLPDKDEVVRLIDDILAIFYPGYFGPKLEGGATMEYHIGAMLDSICTRLSEEIYRALKSDCENQDCEEAAIRHALEFLDKIPQLRAVLATDVQAAYDGDPAAKSYDEVIFSYPAVFAISIYRIAHELFVQGVPLLPRIMSEHAHSRTGIDIHPGALIGESFFIDHGTGVVIGETTIIGRGVKIYQGVTLGARSIPKDGAGRVVRGVKRHPTIEDDVVIYSGATILGGETVIGRGTVIGGNVWLTHSVPPSTRVLISEPQLVIDSKDES